MTCLPATLSRIAKPLTLVVALSVVLSLVPFTPITADVEPDQSLEDSLIAQALRSQAQPTGRLIVKYRTAENPKQHRRGPLRFKRTAWRDQHQLKLDRPLTGYTELVKTGGSLSIQQLKRKAQALKTQSYVEHASIEYRRYPLQQPNDPLYQGSQAPGNQSYLYDGAYSLNAPGAWDITTGSSSSVIAIVDTGILPDHPEVRDRSIEGLGYDFISADNPQDFSSANDGDGRDDNPIDPGDACSGSSSSWHGTAVASAAAGNSNNGAGLAGIDWNARILHARALGVCYGTDADIIDAVRWSAGLPVAGVPDNPTPANVVNLSLGGTTECTQAWQDVIDELADLNIIFVMAAGNENNNALRSAPANCANVITVGSSTPAGLLDGGFSNHGIKVTIATAGRNIVVASNTGTNMANPNGYYNKVETGTSFSAALVSGAISLMHSLNPDLGPAEVRALLHESATPFASASNCDSYYCGAGILDLSRAIKMLRDGNYNPQRNANLEVITSQATPIELQTNTNASLFGYKDIRYFSVAVDERGLLQVESTGANDLYGYLLDSELSVIALDDDSGSAPNFRVAALVDPGTYYFAVEKSVHQLSDGESQFTLSTTLSNDTPSPFEFAPVNDALTSTLVQSNAVTISGLSGESIVTVSDGFYLLNDADPVNTPSIVNNGDVISLAVQTPGSTNRTSIVTLTIGAFSTDFSVTTGDRVSTGGVLDKYSSGCTIHSGHTVDPLFAVLVLTAFIGLIRPRQLQVIPKG